jgi:hypothetical protein
VALIPGLPPETLRIAAQTLEYIERNAQPVIHPGDTFLTSFAKEDIIEPVMDSISQTHHDEDKIEELHEIIDLEDENEEVEEETPEPAQLDSQMMDSRMMNDRERRKMQKVQAKAERDSEKERKRVEREMLKAEREKEKADRKMRAVVAKLRLMELSGSSEA